jgi:hypothetical protein
MKAEGYKPKKNGFPYKLLKYLYENGATQGVVAQEEIGLNAWVDTKGRIYYDRASMYFNMTVKQLSQRGLVKILPEDTYDITKQGRSFYENYHVR